MHFLLILENTNIYIKTYTKICCYMFRSTTIIRELTVEPDYSYTYAKTIGSQAQMQAP
jgi:hypothetical protein